MSAYGYVCATTAGLFKLFGGIRFTAVSQDHLTLPDTVERRTSSSRMDFRGRPILVGRSILLLWWWRAELVYADWGSTIANALATAADIDQRLAGDNMNAYSFWWFMMPAIHWNRGSPARPDDKYSSSAWLRVRAIFALHSTGIFPHRRNAQASSGRFRFRLPEHDRWESGDRGDQLHEFSHNPDVQRRQCADFYQRDAIHHVSYPEHSSASGAIGVQQLIYVYASGRQRHYVRRHILGFNRSRSADKVASSGKLIRGWVLANAEILPRYLCGARLSLLVHSGNAC